MAAAEGKFSFSIDRGGTFTDVYAATPKGSNDELGRAAVTQHRMGPAG